MKKIIASILLICFITYSCDVSMSKKIKGNGNVKTEQRNITSANKIKLAGNFDIELVQSATVGLSIETDENLLSYIVTENKDGWLVISTKDNYNISTKNKLKITITTDLIEQINLAGNGNIIGKEKFSGGDKLKIAIAGNGDVNMNINAPKVEGEIVGNGNIILQGETKDATINIVGNGDYKGENLKAESAEVHITGSGSAKVFADVNLDIHIAGSGDVFYKGNPSITKSITGSGSIKQIQ